MKNVSERCNYCGFPMDTPQRAHDFIHQQGEALIEHRRALYAANERIAALLDALRAAGTLSCHYNSAGFCSDGDCSATHCKAFAMAMRPE